MNVVDLPKDPLKEGSPESLRKALDDLKVRVPILLEYAEVTAEVTYKKYKMLVINGFTEQQAIELLKGSI